MSKKETLSNEDKIRFLENYVDDVESVLRESDDIVTFFKQLVEEGVEKEWPVALNIKGYGCYGGNALYECDWNEAKKCIERLAELTEDPFAYNSLGYIYYYGRCNNGKPDYDNAFKCFTIGNACSVYESTYKLADMMEKGLGVPKNTKAACNLLFGIYDENYDLFLRNHTECKYADIALRIGDYCERGVGVECNLEAAYEFYLKAECAIEKRIKEHNQYGDEKVRKCIKEAINRVREMLPEDYFEEELCTLDPAFIADLLNKCIGIDLTLSRIDGEYYLTAEGMGNENCPGQTLITIPEINYCEVCNKIKVRIENPAFTSIVDEMPLKAFITDIGYDSDKDEWIFLYREQNMLSLICDGFVFEKES